MKKTELQKRILELEKRVRDLENPKKTPEEAIELLESNGFSCDLYQIDINQNCSFSIHSDRTVTATIKVYFR